MASDSLPKDSLLFGSRGSYVVEAVIGRGGFGITYRASASGNGLPDRVAIKEFFPKELCTRVYNKDSIDLVINSPEKFDTITQLRERFVKESRNIEECNHPGIVKVLDTIESNGTAYMVMELVHGSTIKQIMQRNDKYADGLPVEMASDIVRQLAGALNYLHNKHITHLDIKPDNVMLTREGRVVLIDFGLSRRYDESGESDSHILTAISKGYAPPEQYAGIRTFSPESDIYSLGATFYKLLTGITPPEPQLLEEDPGLLYFPDNIPYNYRRAIVASMQPSRRNRPASIIEFVEIMDNDLYHGDEDDEPYIEPKRYRSLKYFLNLIICLAIGVDLYGVGMFWQMRDATMEKILYLTARDALIFLGISLFVNLVGVFSRKVAPKFLAVFISFLILLLLFANL